MPTKYCDHGLYAETCTFVGSIPANSNTLTVASVSAGRITLGMHIGGMSDVLPEGAWISAFGTGTGGTGTYTISFSLLGTAVSGRTLTGSYGPPATVPAWGVAQDGDGEAKGAAAPATAEVVFTGVPSSGAIAVLGATLSPTWATSADNCANLLATAINNATSTASGPASFVRKSQVRNHVYARGPANGAPAGTCQIMTRQGSASHNGLIAVTHTLDNVSSPGTVTFSGGTSGAWGWVYLWSKIWPSQIAEMAYGLWGTTAPYCGNIDNGDVVKMRAGREVKGWTFTGDGFAQSTAMSAFGTDAAPVVYEIDDGTEWPEDGAEPTLKFLMIGQSQTRWTPIQPGAGRLRLKAKKYSDTKYGCEFRVAHHYPATNHINPTFNVQMYAAGVFEGVCYKADSGTLTLPATASAANPGVSASLVTQYRNSRLQAFKQSHWSAAGNVDQNANPMMFRFVDTIIDGGAASDAPNSGVFAWVVSPSGMLAGEFDACRFINFVVGSRLYAVGAVPSNQLNLRLHWRDCDFGGITVLGPKLGSSARDVRSRPVRGVAQGHFATQQSGGQDWFVDTVLGWAAWNSSRSFPTLNARLRDGITPWSIQVIPTQVAGNASALGGFELPRFSKINTLTDGVRSIRMELGVEQSLNWTTQDISMLVEYTDTAGVRRSVDSWETPGTALPTSTATWTNADGSQFTYSEAGNLYFNKKYLQVTTPTPIANGSEIGVIVTVRTSVSDTTKMAFIDPEVQVV